MGEMSVAKANEDLLAFIRGLNPPAPSVWMFCILIMKVHPPLFRRMP